MKRAYVGNIPFATTAEELREWLKPYEVLDVQIIKDHDTGRSKGFAFVEFATPEDFEGALKTHNESYLDERRIVINDAQPKRRGVR